MFPKTYMCCFTR